MPIETGGDFSVGRSTQEGIFFRRPWATVSETDGFTKPAAAVCDGLPGKAQPGCEVFVSYGSQQGIFLFGPLMEPS